MSKVDEFYIAGHRDAPVAELAAAVGATENAVRNFLAALPPAKKEVKTGFLTPSLGVTVMTPAQSARDDASPAKPGDPFAKKHVHVIDPDQPCM